MTPTSPGQHPGTSDPAQGLIWTRPPREKRERPTREPTVAAATGLADTHGLDAVSIRRIAAALQTRPMDLYRYFARKDELIDLMVDEVIAGAVLDELPHHWRDALTAIALDPAKKTSHLARRGHLHHGPRPHQPRPGSQRRQHRTRPRLAGRGPG